MKLKNRIRKQLFSLLFSRGNTFFCVFCGSSYGRFLSSGVDRPVFSRFDVVGAGKRMNAKCPNCFSNDRARLVWLYLSHCTSFFDGPESVLHIAPDPHLARALSTADGIDYVCGGMEYEGLADYGGIRIDVTNIPMENDKFDLVICNHVLEYVPEDWKGMEEIYRVLKPGGLAILQVPVGLSLENTYQVEGLENTRENAVRHYGHSDNLRLYGRDYKVKLEQRGFTVTTRNLFDEHWVPNPKRHGIDPREDIYVAEKPR